MSEAGPRPSDASDEENVADRPRRIVGVVLTVAVALAAAILILLHSTSINGSSFWQWHYRDEPANAGWIALTATVTTMLCMLALRLHERGGNGSRAVSLAIVVVAGFALRLATAWLFSGEITLSYLDYVVRDPRVGSYFVVAERVGMESNLLARYHELMASMLPHARNKPPGLALINLLFIRTLGNAPTQQTAAIVGLACGVASVACVPLSYIFVRALRGSTRAAFHAATLWAICPGAAIFFPLFDPLLTAPVILLAITWVVAMRDDRVAASIAMGLVLAITLFFTFNILPVGLFLAAIGWSAAPSTLLDRAKRFALHAVVVFATAALLHAVFAAATGFNLVATIRAALVNQAELLKSIPRPYPETIWWDLIDYALGVAWVPIVLACIYLTRLRRPLRLFDYAVLAGLVQLLVTAISALLPGETARVWNFLIPLILLPAALELERWPRMLPAIAYGAMAVLTSLLAGHMIFMYAG